MRSLVRRFKSCRECQICTYKLGMCMRVRDEFEQALMVERVAGRVTQVAMEHGSPAALAKYLKDHPDADKAKHSVKKGPAEKKPAGKPAEKKPEAKPAAKKPRTEIDNMRDAVDDPKGNGLDPDDEDDAETIAHYKKEVEKHDADKSKDSKYEKLKKTPDHHRSDDDAKFMKDETDSRENKRRKDQKVRSGG